VKLLPLVLAAFCAVVASVPTMAVANSTASTTSGSQSAERNRRVDVGLECHSDFDLPLDPEWTPLDPRLNSDELLMFSTSCAIRALTKASPSAPFAE